MSRNRPTLGPLLAVGALLTLPAVAAARQADPAAGEVVVETLLAVTLPTAAFPAGPVVVSLGHWTWEPGASASVPAGSWETGIVVDRVLVGSYAATTRVAWRNPTTPGGTAAPLARRRRARR